jgi:UDP-N-acetylmuramoylalanine-D-glutamate ligase
MGRAPVLVDDAPASPALDGLEVLATGSGGLAALLRCDVVVKSPGISRYRTEVAQLEAAGVPVCGGLGLFMEEADPTRVACITGTKGKSTTTALAVHLLTRLGYRARAGGNIGQPPWDPAAQPEPDFWIVETSSFQVPDLWRAPEVVAVTSLSPDHLDWHGTVERYYADKLSLCTKPGVALALADGSDDLLRARCALGQRVRCRTGQDVVGGDRSARFTQREERVHRPRRARRPGHPRRIGRRSPRRGGRRFRWAAEPLSLARNGRRGGVRRRQSFDQRAPCAGGAARLR